MCWTQVVRNIVYRLSRKFLKGFGLDLQKLFIAELYNAHAFGTYETVLSFIFSKGEKL